MKVRKEYHKEWFGIKTLEKMSQVELYNVCSKLRITLTDNRLSKETLLDILEKNGNIKHFTRGRKKKDFKIEDLIKIIRQKIADENLLEKYVNDGSLTISF